MIIHAKWFVDNPAGVFGFNLHELNITQDNWFQLSDVKQNKLILDYLNLNIKHQVILHTYSESE